MSVRHELELQRLRRELASARAQLRHAGKLAAIGQIVAGVAHEINNPLSYLHANNDLLQEYLDELLPATSAPQQAAARRELAQLLEESRAGMQRVLRIARDLKDFARAGDSHAWQWADLHQGMESTLNMAANAIRCRAELICDYGQLPPVPCVPSQLNQVLLNLLINAAQAIDGPRGTITLRTGQLGEMAWFAVSDTGCGIAAADRARIFEPFFTTKPAGVGTGLGLSLAHDIVRQHGGRIEVDSEVGRGTTVRVLLPLQRSAVAADAGYGANATNGTQEAA
jgi:signal transduction histidine kinase